MLHVWLENAYSRPPKWGCDINKTPRGTLLSGKTSYDSQIVKIGPPVRPESVTKRPKKKDNERNMTVGSWLFADTTHVVTSKCRLSWWVVLGR